MDDIITSGNIDFGDWGTMPVETAMEVLTETLAYFDQEVVRQEEETRADMIKAARRYYNGNHIKPMRVKSGEPDDNVIVNLCRTLVDDGVSWLFGDMESGVITFEAEGADLSGEGGDWFDSLWESNGGLRLLKRIGKRGAISGHVFVKLVEPEDGQEYPQIVALDPLMISVRTAPGDSDMVQAYKLEWLVTEMAAGTYKRTEYIYRQLTVNAGTDKEPYWLLAEFKSQNKSKRKWELTSGPYGWAYRWSPIHDCANMEAPWGYYGLSDLEDAAWLNDNINFLASNTMRILKFHAHPKTVGTGFMASDIQDTSIDTFWSIPNPEAKVYNLEMDSDLQSSLAMLDFIRTAFWTIGRGMDVSVYKDKIGSVTNFALRVLSIRALQKMGDKRDLYGKLIRAINSHAQELMGVEDPLETTINFPSPLPLNDMEEMNTLSQEVAMEITSKQTAAEERGRDWEKERARIAQERASVSTLGEYLLTQFDRGGFQLDEPELTQQV